MSDELIAEAVNDSRDKFNPMQHLNKLLSLWHNNNVKTVAESKNYTITTSSYYAPKKKVVNNQKNREYSKNELNALFDNLEEVEL